MGAVVKSLPHLARPADRIAKEVLAFCCLMLFNANEEVQVCPLTELCVCLRSVLLGLLRSIVYAY